VAWKTAIPGKGWSSPVVCDGRIWLTTATSGGKKLEVVAVDAKSGKIVRRRVVFEVEAPEAKNALNSYASPSATAEPGRVYVHFGSVGTACLDAGTARSIWERRDLPCDHKEGPGSSPVLYEDLLIFNADGIDVQYVVALDKKTGRTRWKQDRSIDLARFPADQRKAYNTPIVIDVEGKPRLISTGAEATMAYDPRTGRELWRVRHKGFSNVSRPVFGHGLLYLNSGFVRPRLLAVQAAGEGDVTKTNVVWTHSRSVPTMPSPLLVEGRLYMVSHAGVASCLDARSGKELWRERVGGEHSASPVYVGGRICFFGRDGRTVVIAPGEKFRELAVNSLAAGFMASPAVVGNALILRTVTHLYRVQASAGN